MTLTTKARRLAALLVTLTLLLTSCGLTPPTATAATIHLRQTEGNVAVSDGDGKDVEPRDNLGLYSGYGVETKRTSHAWIDLDEVKLTKLDEKSAIEITKDGKDLEIEVLSGSLFFNVTEPLENDETMTIRSSTMSVGIRGTCGWVTLEDDEHLTLYLLEGEVECTAGEESVRVSAGETARMSIEDEAGEITVNSFAEADIPDFVLDELDEDFLDEIRGFLPQGLAPEILAALQSIHYYGDPSRCTMTPEQASAFAQVIRDNVAQLGAMRPNAGENWVVNGIEVPQDIPSVYTAALFDLGDGTPALIFAGGTLDHQWDNRYSSFWPHGKCGIWLYQDGAAVQYAPSAGRQALFDGYLLTGGMREVNEDHIYKVYPISGGAIADQPSATADVTSHVVNSNIVYSYLINDTEVSFDDFSAWIDQWVGAEYDAASNDWTGDTSLAGFGNGTDVGCSGWGLISAEDVLAVLDNWGR